MAIIRIPADVGRKYQSGTGWFYLGVNTDIYKIHFELGRFCFPIARSDEHRLEAASRRMAAFKQGSANNKSKG